MSRTNPSGAEPVSLDRRRLLGRSAAGIVLPAAMAASGLPGGHAAAHSMSGRSTLDEPRGRVQEMSNGGLAPARLERMSETMARIVERGDVAGLVGLVSRGGDVHVDAVGTFELDGGSPMRRDTIFRIFSVGKPITAVAAMILVEECVLRLDDPVDPLLPELADRQVLRSITSPLDDTVPANRPITLRDLLTFRLGYGAIFTPPGQSPLAQALVDAGVASGPILPSLPPDDFMRVYQDLPLAHQPGEQWLYNTGSDMLGVLIARTTGISLGEFMQERVFAPLGMKDTAFSVPAEKMDRLPAAYWTTFGTTDLEVIDGIEDSQFGRPPAFEAGSGGMVSTVDDLLVFGEMMLNNGTYGNERILSRPSIEVMTTDQITPEQKAASAANFFPSDFWERRGWGFGTSIITRRDAVENTPGRYGWDGGWGTSWYVDPTEGFIGIMMTQRVFDSVMMGVYNDFWVSAYQAIDD